MSTDKGKVSFSQECFSRCSWKQNYWDYDKLDAGDAPLFYPLIWEELGKDTNTLSALTA